jgi:hypothetical protein
MLWDTITGAWHIFVQAIRPKLVPISMHLAVVEI